MPQIYHFSLCDELSMLDVHEVNDIIDIAVKIGGRILYHSQLVHFRCLILLGQE